jgi:photosystem II stability/assembly factor-like uncharacterized protein
MRPLDVRALRGLAVMVVCLAGLATVITVYFHSDLSRRAVPPEVLAGPRQPDLASSMDWVSDQEGWLSALDRQAGTSTLFHTADGGRHWTRLRVSTSVEDVDFFDPRHGVLHALGAPWQSGPSLPAVATYRTSDGGRHWQRLTPPKGTERQVPAFADAGHGWVWDPAPAGLYATADGGGHWRRLRGAGLPRIGQGVPAIGFRDARHGWLAAPAGRGDPTLYATSDGGDGWTAQPLPAPAGGWADGAWFQVGPVGVAADGRGQLMVSELVPWARGLVVVARWVAATGDGGATWSAPVRVPDTPPGTVLMLTVSRVDGSVSWAWSAGELLTTRDGGVHWTRLALPPGWSIDRLRAVDADTAWAAANVTDGRGASRWSLFSTGDAGASWTEATTPRLS